MCRCLCDHNERTVLVHGVLNLLQNRDTCVVVGGRHGLLIHVCQLLIHISRPACTKSYHSARQELQLYVRVIVIGSPVHHSEAQGSVTVSVTIACCPGLRYDIYVDTDLCQIVLYLLSQVRQEYTLHIQIAYSQIYIEALCVTSLSQQRLCFFQVGVIGCSLTLASHEAHLDDVIGRQSTLSADGLDSGVVQSLTDCLLYLRICHGTAVGLIHVHHHKAYGLGSAIDDLDTISALQLFHGVVGHVHGHVDVTAGQSHHLGVGIRLDLDDIFIYVGCLTPVVRVLLQNYFLVRGIAGHHIHTGACAGGIQVGLCGIGGSRVLSVSSTILLYNGTVQYRQRAVGQLGKDGAVLLIQMENDGLLIGSLDAVDGIRDEGRVALQVLAAVDAESHIRRGHGVAACEGNAVLQGHSQGQAVLRELVGVSQTGFGSAVVAVEFEQGLVACVYDHGRIFLIDIARIQGRKTGTHGYHYGTGAGIS